MNRRLVFALAAMATAQAAVYIARPVTSYRLLGLGFGARDVGLVAASFALLPLFLALPLGRAADRRHARALLAGGCAVQMTGCLLLALARTPLALAAGSAVLGLGHLALALGVQAVIARESDDEHHDQHFGLLTAGVSLGQLIGPLVAGAIVGGSDLEGTTTRALLVAAGIAALATAFGALAERGSRLRVPEHDGAPRERIAAILGTRGVPAGIFASIAVLSAADIFTAYLPVVGEQRGIAPGAVGALLALRAGASMVSRVGIRTIVTRVGRVRLLALSAVAAAAAFAAVTAVGNVYLLAALACVAGFGLGFGQPLSMTIVVQLVPTHARATALAVRLAGNRVGQVAAPAGAGFIAGGAGAASVFWLTSAMLVLSGLAIRREGGPDPQQGRRCRAAI